MIHFIMKSKKWENIQKESKLASVGIRWFDPICIHGYLTISSVIQIKCFIYASSDTAQYLI